MPEHVYLTPVPDSRSEPTAFSSRNIPSQVVVSRTTLCTLFFCQSFQSKIPTQRNHTFSASVRSTEQLCWLPAKSNRCASAARPGRLPKRTPVWSPPVLAARQKSPATYNTGSNRKISHSWGWQIYHHLMSYFKTSVDQNSSKFGRLLTKFYKL